MDVLDSLKRFNLPVFLKLIAPVLILCICIIAMSLFSDLDIFSTFVYALLITGLLSVLGSLYDCFMYFKLFRGLSVSKATKG